MPLKGDTDTMSVRKTLEPTLLPATADLSWVCHSKLAVGRNREPTGESRALLKVMAAQQDEGSGLCFVSSLCQPPPPSKMCGCSSIRCHSPSDEQAEHRHQEVFSGRNPDTIHSKGAPTSQSTTRWASVLSSNESWCQMQREQIRSYACVC